MGVPSVVPARPGVAHSGDGIGPEALEEPALAAGEAPAGGGSCCLVALVDGREALVVLDGRDRSGGRRDGDAPLEVLGLVLALAVAPVQPVGELLGQADAVASAPLPAAGEEHAEVRCVVAGRRAVVGAVADHELAGRHGGPAGAGLELFDEEAGGQRRLVERE